MSIIGKKVEVYGYSKEMIGTIIEKYIGSIKVINEYPNGHNYGKSKCEQYIPATCYMVYIHNENRIIQVEYKEIVRIINE